jgi:hypothetical protein
VTFNNGSNGEQTADSGDDTGRGLVTINNQTGAITFNEEYYALGQIAKFVQPGAVRIGSNSEESVAFMNPDALKTVAVVAYNSSSSTESYQFVYGNDYFTYAIPSDAVVSFSFASLNMSAGITVYETDAYTNQYLTEEAMLNFVPTPEPTRGLAMASVASLTLRRRRPRRRRPRHANRAGWTTTI